MLFLLNSVVFDLDEACPAPAHDLRRFANLNVEAVMNLGCELFAEEPDLHLSEPTRARRLAWLIAHRCDGVNAALFLAPETGCEPLMVEPRLCAVPKTLLSFIKARRNRQPKGRSAVDMTDRLIWNLSAA